MMVELVDNLFEGTDFTETVWIIVIDVHDTQEGRVYVLSETRAGKTTIFRTLACY